MPRRRNARGNCSTDFSSLVVFSCEIGFDGAIVSGASPSVGHGGTLLVHPFRACMIAAAIMIGEYLCSEYFTCSLTLQPSKNLGLV
jgi:hypothetical protein